MAFLLNQLIRFFLKALLYAFKLWFISIPACYFMVSIAIKGTDRWGDLMTGAFWMLALILIAMQVVSGLLSLGKSPLANIGFDSTSGFDSDILDDDYSARSLLNDPMGENVELSLDVSADFGLSGLTDEYGILE